MKKLIVLLFLKVSLASCEQMDCCVMPELSIFHGDWKLVRVTNGFAQLDLIDNAIGYKEELSIDASAKTFIRKREGSPEKKSTFEKGRQGDLDALILLDENMYHWYSFEDWRGANHLLLYQKSILDAVLADGSWYYYARQKYKFTKRLELFKNSP
ncbi:MAG: hypothetical protein ACI8UX_001245 [Psychromonas sp.]|jgi:hypothetical protein